MADNVQVTAGSGTVVATDQLSDNSQSPKVSVMDGTGSTVAISPATSGNQTTTNTKLDTLNTSVQATTTAVTSATLATGTAGSPATSTVLTVQGVTAMTPIAVSGTIGLSQTVVTVTQTVTASSAYASGNCVGALITIANAAASSGGSGTILAAVVDCLSAQTTQMDLIFFDSDPSSGSTITDKTALAIAAAGSPKAIGVNHITDWTSLGTPSLGQGQNQPIPFSIPSGTTLYAVLVTRATPTFAATGDITVRFEIQRN